jgi:hypothetical protein
MHDLAIMYVTVYVTALMYLIIDRSHMYDDLKKNEQANAIQMLPADPCICIS